MEVFIVEGQVEDEEEEEDAFIVVAAPSNPEEDNGDFVVIVGRLGSIIKYFLLIVPWQSKKNPLKLILGLKG